MFALIAAVLFAIAFILTAGAVATSAVFSPLAITFVGLALLALHFTGRGPAMPNTRRSRR